MILSTKFQSTRYRLLSTVVTSVYVIAFFLRKFGRRRRFPTMAYGCAPSSSRASPDAVPDARVYGLRRRTPGALRLGLPRTEINPPGVARSAWCNSWHCDCGGVAARVNKRFL